MKVFKQKELKDAFAYADEEKGQALHVYTPTEAMKRKHNLPKCFKKNDDLWAHLMDNDTDRLIRTAKQLGVSIVKVEREGRQGQHVDLCGAPLIKAIAKAKGMTG
jgi:hypothetical protein